MFSHSHLLRCLPCFLEGMVTFPSAANQHLNSLEESLEPRDLLDRRLADDLSFTFGDICHQQLAIITITMASSC